MSENARHPNSTGTEDLFVSPLRPEARPLTWSRLSSSQREAFTSIAGLIFSAINELPMKQGNYQGESAQSSRMAMDSHRSNNVVMLSGKRGTGKTSLFLSIRNVLNPARSRTDREKFGLVESIKFPLKSHLNEMSQRLVWLETLDLEPLPHRSSLFAAIIARIEDAVREEHGAWPNFDTWAAGERQTGVEKAIQEFDRLANDVSFGWDDGVTGTNHSFVEPEIYARDARRAERSRLSLRARLDHVLNLFAVHVQWKNNVTNPLFILPIDDFDLNPKKCLELLRLLRGIGNSRLFPLILGDVDVARLVLDLKMQGELEGVLNGGKLTKEQSHELQREAKGLSTEAIRKLLPPHQRLYLKTLSLKEALDFQPAPEDAAEKASDTLAVLMKSTIELSANQLRKNQREELFALDANNQQWPRSLVARYSGVFALQGTVRELTDRWLGLARIQYAQSTRSDFAGSNTFDITSVPDPLFELFWKELFACWRGEERLPDEWRRELKEDDVESLGRFPPFSMEVSTKTSRLKMQSVDYPPIQIEVRRFERLYIETESETGNSRSEFGATGSQATELSRKATSSFILVHDLLQNSPLLLIEKPPVVPSMTKARLLNVNWSLVNEELEVQWIAPTFTAFIDYEKFAAWWNSVADRVCAPSAEFQYASLEPLALLWLLAGFATATKQSTDWQTVRDFVESAHGMLDTNTGLVIDRLKEQYRLRCNDSTHRVELQRWASDLAVFLAPENGVPRQLAEQFSKDSEIQNLWTKRSQSIRQQRRSTLKRKDSYLTHLLLNPKTFESRCLTYLEQAPNIVLRSEGFESLKSILVSRPTPMRPSSPRRPVTKKTSPISKPFDEITGLTSNDSETKGMNLKEVRKSLTDLRSRFANRNSLSGKALYRKNLNESRELLRRAVGGLQRFDTPTQQESLFRQPEVSETIQWLSSILNFLEMLSECFQLHSDSESHPINQFSNGLLCPDIKYSDLP